ncbi:MAG: glycosyltransferase family 39 protein [Parachlamydiales bacterium]|nr:glycosyltransferase family 39 protein [Parachlamydiales bacterium]
MKKKLSFSLKPTQQWALFLLFFLILKALVIFLVIQYSSIKLSPDESQYWVWSKSLSYGYYSKPPGIAWQIALTTFLFGDTEWGVRCGALLLSIGSCFALYRLALLSNLSAKTAFWAAIIFSFSPLGFFGSLAATTDGGLTLFWILSLCELAPALKKGKPEFWKVGLWIGLGALFKWSSYILWIFVLGLLYFHKKWRDKEIWTGLAISIIGLIPSYAWNATHDFATFRHVFNQMQGGQPGAKASGNFFEFLGSQIGLLSPLYFGLLVFGLIALLFNKKMRGAVQTWGWLSCILMVFYLGFSLFFKVQSNWMIFAYPTIAIVIAWYAQDIQKWLWSATGLSVFIVLILLLIPIIQNHSVDATHPLPYKLNPFQQCLGWNKIDPALRNAGYDPKKHFLFGDKYQMTSLLSFYSPGQKRAYFLNLLGTRNNQFTFWPSLAQEKLGKDGYYVVDWNKTTPSVEHKDRIINKLKPYFYSVDYVSNYSLFESYTIPSKGVMIFKCTHYNGKVPPVTNRY